MTSRSINVMRPSLSHSRRCEKQSDTSIYFISNSILWEKREWQRRKKRKSWPLMIILVFIDLQNIESVVDTLDGAINFFDIISLLPPFLLWTTSPVSMMHAIYKLLWFWRHTHYTCISIICVILVVVWIYPFNDSLNS